MKMKMKKVLPYEEDGWIINEGGTRWRPLSVLVDEMLSMLVSVGNGEKDDVEGKKLPCSFGTVNWSIEFVIADWNYNLN